MMKIKHVTADPVDVRADAIAVLVRDNYELTKSGSKLNTFLKGHLKGGAGIDTFHGSETEFSPVVYRS